MPSYRIKSAISPSQLAYATFSSALIYATGGAAEAWRTSSFHIVSGAVQALPLFAAGLAPLAVIVLFFTFYRGKLVERERRACLVGAALTSLILLPLLRLAF